ncbi:hypothetical protein FJY71_06730 [candidate division WOR-3 bacterium]|nr:hypothetical protein [candidate division WOR-3 bacterium]
MRRIAGRDYYEAGAAWDDGTFRWWPIASTCDFSSRDGTVICAYERVATSGGMMLPFPHRISLLRFTLGRLSWSDLLAGNPFSVSQLTWNVAPTDADPVIYAGGGYYDDDGAAQQDRFCVVLLEKWQLWDTYAAYVFTWDRPTTSWTGFARTAIGLPTGAFRRWALAVRVGKAVIVDSISEGYFRLDLAPAWIEGGTHTRNFNFPSSLTLRYSSWVAADSPGPVRSAISLYTSGPDRWLQRITWDDVVGVVITRISQPDAAVPPAYEPTLWDVISVWSTRPRKSAPVPAVIDALGAIGFIAGRVALMYPAFPAVVNMDAAPATENLQEFLAACQEATGCFVRFLPGQLIAQTRTLGPAAAAYRFPTSLVLADGTELTRLTRQVVVVNGAGGAVGRWPAVPDPALDLGTFNVSSEYVPSTAVQVFARWLYEMLYEQFNWSLEADLDLPLQLETGDEIRLAVPAMELHGRVTRLNWPAPAPDTWGRARMRMAGVEVM